MTIGTYSSAPEADLASTPVASGVPRRGDHRVDREGRGSAQDRADIVRIGDLVEHQHGAGRSMSSISSEGRGSASTSSP